MYLKYAKRRYHFKNNISPIADPSQFFVKIPIGKETAA
jgi:hypothetical protein